MKNLKAYYESCECDVAQFKDFLLYLYLRCAPCLNRGQEARITEKLGPREQIEEYSKEKLFVLTLCFSGKIKWPNILELYSDVICQYDLEVDELKRLVWQFNE